LAGLAGPEPEAKGQQQKKLAHGKKWLAANIQSLGQKVRQLGQ
jgi:hypothetical protein